MAVFGGGGVRPVKIGKRSQEFENLLGNLLITQYQETRIIQRLVDTVTDWKKGPTRSSFMFNHPSDKGVWFQVNVEVKRMLVKDDEPTEKVESESETNSDELSSHFP